MVETAEAKVEPIYYMYVIDKSVEDLGELF